MNFYEMCLLIENQENLLIQALVGLEPYANLAYADWLQEHGRDAESDAWRLVENESFFSCVIRRKEPSGHQNCEIIESFSSSFTGLAHRLLRNKWKVWVAHHCLVSTEAEDRVRVKFMAISTIQCEEEIFLQILYVLYQAGNVQTG